MAIPQVAGHSAIRTALKTAAGRTINRLEASVDLSAHPPAAAVSLAQTAMGVAVHSAIVAAIRLVAFRVATRPEVSPVVTRLEVSRVAVTEAAEAADKCHDDLS